MIKSIKAFLKGYTYFEVNGKGFWTYDTANTYCEGLRHMRVMDGTKYTIRFNGFNIYHMRWECIYGWTIGQDIPKYFTQVEP